MLGEGFGSVISGFSFSNLNLDKIVSFFTKYRIFELLYALIIDLV